MSFSALAGDVAVQDPHAVTLRRKRRPRAGQTGRLREGGGMEFGLAGTADGAANARSGAFGNHMASGLGDAAPVAQALPATMRT